MTTKTTWTLIVPALFIFAAMVLYALMKRRKFFLRLKPVIPYLLILSGLSFILLVLSSSWGIEHIRSSALLLFFEIVFFFCVLVVSVKFITFILFDFIIGNLHHSKYSRLFKIKDVLVILLYIIGIILFARIFFNTELTVFAASSAVITVVAGFALQDILGDLFAGIALNLEESIRHGDWIKTGNIEGKIEQFRWRSIKIRTTDNTLVVIPNRIASKQEVQRFGDASEPFSVRLRIGVSYKNTPDSVISNLMQVADSVSEVLKDPEPSILIVEFGDFAITYEMKFWITDYGRRDPIKSEVRRKIWYKFNRNNIHIPYPVQDIHIKEFKRDTKNLHNSCELIDILKRNEIMDTISEDQLANIVEYIEIKNYGNGEVLINEGEAGKYFFHILEGSADVLKDNKVLTQLKEGDFVGEISLFTGEKTTATVRLTSESRVMRISSDNFRETVKINENMARKLSDVIAQRRSELTAFSMKEDNLKSAKMKDESETIFLRIKKYFSF